MEPHTDGVLASAPTVPASPAEPSWKGWGRSLLVPGIVTAWALHSLAQPGYLLQVDSVFGPHQPAPSAGFGALASFIPYLLGGALGGRVLVGGALFLAAAGPMVYTRRLPWVAQLFAGLLGALNPFVYGRLVEGQWGIPAATGVLFIWLVLFEELLRHPGPRRAAAAALAGALAIFLEPQAVGPLVVLALGVWLWQRAPGRPGQVVWSAVCSLLLAGLCLYGALPFFLGHGTASYAAVRRFSSPDLVAFRASTSPQFGLWANLLGLYGFWPERLNRIPMLNSGAPWWPVTTALLVAAAVWGAWANRQRAWFLGAGILGVLAAGSTATQVGQRVVLWLMAHFPLVGVYREPEKWSVLWLMALIVLGADAMASWLRRLQQTTVVGPGKLAAAVATGAVAVAILFPSGTGALRELPATVVPYRYPRSWETAAAFLSAHVKAGQEVVVLPWELYEPLPFTHDRLVANPGPVVFPGRLLEPNDLQIPGVLSEVTSPDNLAQASLAVSPGSCRLGQVLAKLEIQWAVVEPAPVGAADLRTLERCGFTLAEGHDGQVAVLHSQAP